MTSTGPLRGIKVIDFTAYQNGPMSTRLLADYGATCAVPIPPFPTPPLHFFTGNGAQGDQDRAQ